MKKYLLTIFMVLGIVSGILASAFITHFSKVTWLKEGDVVTLVYEDDLPTKVRVTLLDSFNSAVFSEVIEMPCGFRRPYNLEELPEGEYVFEVLDDEKKYRKRIEHKAFEDELEACVSRLDCKEEKYLLSVPNALKEEITISIYDDESNLFYREKEKVKKGFAKIYRLKREPSAKKGKALVFLVSDNHGDYVAIQKNRE